jgi:hypothetical protein
VSVASEWRRIGITVSNSRATGRLATGKNHKLDQYVVKDARRP